MIASISVNMVRYPQGSHIVIPIAVSGGATTENKVKLIGAVIHKQASRHKVPKSVLRAVLGRMQFTLHATRRAPHGALRLVQAMSAWLEKTRRAPSRHSRDARVYGHSTTAMHKLSTPPLPPPILKPPSSPHRLYDLQDIHDKLMHSVHSRQNLSLSKTGFIVFPRTD